MDAHQDLPAPLREFIDGQLLAGEEVIWAAQPVAQMAVADFHRKTVRLRMWLSGGLVAMLLAAIFVPGFENKCLISVFFLMAVVSALFFWGGPQIEREELEKLKLSAGIITNQRAMYICLGDKKAGNQSLPIYPFIWKPSRGTEGKSTQTIWTAIGGGAMEFESRLVDLKYDEDAGGAGSVTWTETVGSGTINTPSQQLQIGFFYFANVRAADHHLRALLPASGV